MRKYISGIVAFGIMGLLFGNIQAQQVCALDDSGIRTDAEIQFAAKSNAYQKTSGVVRIVPVVVSVFSNSTSGDISDAQVASGINVLNEAFRGQYGGVDTEIEFCLSGIKRFTSSIYANATLGPTGNELALKQQAQEDPFSFYNVYVVESMRDFNNAPAYGYTILPTELTAFPDFDGTVIQHSFWGNVGTAGSLDSDFDLGRIAVHEAGHWLNLHHPFGSCDFSWNCEAENDCCCDTPPMNENERFVCRERRNTCRTDSPDERDPIHNYMGYTEDDCRTEFTQCQSLRMNYTLDVLRTGAFHTVGDCPPFKKETTAGNDGFFQPIGVRVFPNPFQEAATAEVSVMDFETRLGVNVYDVTGKLVEIVAEDMLAQQGAHRFEFGAGLVSGMYFLKVKSLGAVKMVKVLKR